MPDISAGPSFRPVTRSVIGQGASLRPRGSQRDSSRCGSPGHGAARRDGGSSEHGCEPPVTTFPGMRISEGRRSWFPASDPTRRLCGSTFARLSGCWSQFQTVPSGAPDSGAAARRAMTGAASPVIVGHSHPARCHWQRQFCLTQSCLHAAGRASWTLVHVKAGSAATGRNAPSAGARAPSSAGPPERRCRLPRLTWM
jgi:hypothetical protein